MRIFGDTSAWLPFFDRYEEKHESVRQVFNRFSRGRLKIYVTDYVFDEILTLIVARVDHATAVAGGNWLLQSPFVQLINVDADVWRQAWDMFRQYDDKRFSFTDCISFVVMRQQKLVDAFTFDHHFEQMGFRMWPA